MPGAVSACNSAQARPVLRRAVPLADSLLSAIVRADGDALVMHIGERPYVVVGTLTINISTNGLTLEQMVGMLGQLLPQDAQIQLEEFGAVEYTIPFPSEDRFTIVAARGGDDVWIEIRRRRVKPAAVAAPVAAPVVEVAVVEPAIAASPVEEPTPLQTQQPIEAPAPVAPIPEPVA